MDGPAAIRKSPRRVRDKFTVRAAPLVLLRRISGRVTSFAGRRAARQQQRRPEPERSPPKGGASVLLIDNHLVYFARLPASAGEWPSQGKFGKGEPMGCYREASTARSLTAPGALLPGWRSGE